MITRIDNGLVWSAGELRALSLLIDGEKISALIDPDQAATTPAEQVIDAGGLWVLPGGIDFHVHVSDGIETFYPGTCCAGAGGITTVFDMAPFHACTTVEQLFEKAAQAEKECVVDFGLIAGIVVDASDLDHLADVSRAGAAYFKVFQPSNPAVTTETLWKAIQAAASTGLRLGLHAEDPAYFSPQLDVNDPLGFPHARPAVAEASVVAQVIEMARFAGAPVHICHVSTGRTAELVAGGKAHGVDITCEVPPHFLLLDESAFVEYGARVKTTPPLRSKLDREELWQALAEGVIDLIACDHYTESVVPLPKEAKYIPDAAAGIAGLELSLPLMMAAVLDGRISLKRFVEASAEKPSELARICGVKGRLLPGMHADLTLWSPTDVWSAGRETPFTRIETTPYAGWNLKGRLCQTWVRGEPVWNGEAIQKAAGYGRWIRSNNPAAGSIEYQAK